ncbi:MAG: Phosphopantetheine attachment site [Desulfovibrionales bacterium]|nr:Phosphopantetheine attachment site [Desulfovibrionales bacterium]
MSKVTVQDVFKLFEAADLDIDVTELDPAAPLLEQELDSLDMMNVYFQIEETYGISVGEDSIASGDWDTMQKIADSLNASLSSQG